METYRTIKERHQRDVNTFPLGAAFSDSQFAEMMKKFGLKANETAKVCSIGYGMFCKKDDLPAFKEMIANHKKELHDAIFNKETGEEFAYEMFRSEFYNHECGYTGDFTDGVNATGLSFETISANEFLCNAYNRARADVLAAF